MKYIYLQAVNLVWMSSVLYQPLQFIGYKFITCYYKFPIAQSMVISLFIASVSYDMTYAVTCVHFHMKYTIK